MNAMTRETFRRNTHPGAQWFPAAELGLFLHWGVSSVHGGIDISWGMMAGTPWDREQEDRNKVTPNEYFALADRFAPRRYDPDRWLRAARDAGFQYAVLTTRHHDGYAMWPSAYGDFSTRTRMGGRDLVGPFVEACRANGLKAGLYYSPADWHWSRHAMSFHYGSGDPEHWPGRAHFGLDHEPLAELPKPTAEDERAFVRYVNGQVEELLTRWGTIDVLWFDSTLSEPIPFETIREMQPSILVNERMHGYGDFTTPECALPEAPPSGWWEMCDMFNRRAWGYTSPPEYNGAERMFARFAKARAMGGNYLLNMAPDPDGELPAIAYERLREWKKLMEARP
jgi:alpha-L-fucosidase